MNKENKMKRQGALSLFGLEEFHTPQKMLKMSIVLKSGIHVIEVVHPMCGMLSMFFGHI